jgi:shikimate dehydrogenase
MEISGKTKLYVIVADPIGQVKTPQNINKWIAQAGADAVLVPMHVSPENLASWFAAMRGIKNLGGIVVTVPHKMSIRHLCDQVTPAAEMVGAVNVIRREPDGRMLGDILDGQGFVAGLKQSQIALQSKQVLLCGAGGAANAIAFALAQAGVARLGIYNRTRPKVDEMIARLSPLYPEVKIEAVTSDPTGFDLIVNATSLGMAVGDALPLDAQALLPGQTVAEIIMTPALTPLLEVAQSLGCKIQYGLPMLECQIALMARFMKIGEE